MVNKCGACGRYGNATEGVKCSKCSTYYHRQCVNIPQEVKVTPLWHCPGCKVKTPRKDNSENPVKGVEAEYSSSPHSFSVAISEKLMQEVLEEMRSFRDDIKALRTEMASLSAAVMGFGGRMDSVETRVVACETKLAELQNRPTTDELLITIEQLKSEINIREQQSLLNDIEITGLPEESGENVTHLVTLVAEKLGVSCEERDFVCVERVGPRPAPSVTESRTAPRPRSVVVRLVHRQLRETFLKHARVRRRITTEGFQLKCEPSRLYVNEHLTRKNKYLFFKAREESRRLGWRYVWTKEGRIYVRREAGTASFRVQTVLDIEKIFGLPSVGEDKSVS